MKKNKKIIISLMLVISIIIVIMIILIINIMRKGQVQNKETSPNLSEQYKNVLERISDSNTFYTLESCAKRFVIGFAENDDEIIKALLQKQYDKEDIEKILPINGMNFDNDLRYNATQMYGTNGSEWRLYFIKGNLNDVEIYLALEVDNVNNTYDATLLKEEEYERIVEKNSVDEVEYKEIEKNEWNNIVKISKKSEDIVQEYFNEYISCAIENIEEAYKLLDEDYRKEKFNSIDEYKKYLENIKDLLDLLNVNNRKKYTEFSTYEEYEEYYRKFTNVGITEFAINNYKDYKQYICYDHDGNIYIFNEKYPKDYSVILDTYTIELPSITGKYNNASNENKVIMNLEKIRLAMNDADYKYVYNKLDESFKIKNYPVQQNFESIVKSQLFPKNEFEITSIEKQNEIYIVNVKVTDAAKASQEEKNMKVVMQLGENTDFVMSFSMQ